MTQTEDLANRILDLAWEVHHNTGPGLYGDAYRRCMAIELSKAGIPFQERVKLTIPYDGKRIESDYVADLVVADRVVVQVKGVDQLESDHDAELKTFMLCSGCTSGLMINFNTVVLTDGIRRQNGSWSGLSPD